MNRADFTLIEAQLKARVNEVDALARQLYPAYAKAPPTTVSFYYKGRSAGTAKVSSHHIVLNAGQAIQSDAIGRLTVPHEMAHLVAYHLFRDGGHGRHWKAVCRRLGGDGIRCYDAAERGVTIIPGRRTREYLYMSSCGAEVWVGPVHHKRLQQRGPQGYRIIYTPTGGRVVHTEFKKQSRYKV